MRHSGPAAVLLVGVVVLGRGALRGATACEEITPVPGDAITLQLVSNAVARPVDVTAPPGDTERLFVVEQGGRIRIIRLPQDSLVATPFLDISGLVVFSGGNDERGLLGLAFHPDYAENGYFFVNYTRSSDGATIVARYRVSSNADVADRTSAVMLLTIAQPYTNHNGGQLQFGPFDGYLYVSTGDGGSGGDPQNYAQNGLSLLGKLLRLDADNRAGALNYAIPPDNPFLSNAGVRNEIWALGLRNPWRFSFDPLNGDLYIGDVGQNLWEEIDYVPGTSTGGENYQWKRLEGKNNFSTGTSYGAGTPTGPILEYPHSGAAGAMWGHSVTGGVVYRGCKMPDLHGTYFFADYADNWVRSMKVVDGAVTDLRNRTAELNAGISGSLSSISAFGTDARGEIYLCSRPSSSRLYRIVPVKGANNPPAARITTDPSPAVVPLQGGTAVAVLDGSRSHDNDRGTQPLSFLWEKVSGPEGDEIAEPLAAVTTVSFRELGEYVYRLTVDDGDGQGSREVTVTVTEPPPPRFRRGDANTDGLVDISDGVRTLLHLFAAGPVPACLDAADADGSGVVDLTDAIFTFGYLFTGGPLPPPPGPTDCGEDPNENELDCESYNACS
jgi:glucose/arabinose dehydrogenase